MSQDEHVPDAPILASPLPGEDVADIDGPDQDVDQTPLIDTGEGTDGDA